METKLGNINAQNLVCEVNELPATCMCMQAVKFSSNNILHFLIGLLINTMTITIVK